MALIENYLREIFFGAAWLDMSFAGNTLISYVITGLLFIGILFLLRIIKFLISTQLRKISKKTKTTKDDLVINIFDKFGWFFYVSIAVYFSLQRLNIAELLNKWIDGIILVIVTYYIVKAIFEAINYGKSNLEKKRDSSDFLDIYIKILKGIIWIIAILVILANMGVNITSVVATLGIGGIAIALALQNVLSDVFASLSIHFDKPFKVGDFIIVGQDMGVVKKIGIKSTRIESLWGQEIVISNQELTSTRINNYKKMEKRRIQFAFGVNYNTKNAKLKKIKKIVQDIYKSIKKADLDRVHFKAYGTSSLDYEIAYYINSNDYNEYMDIQEEINLKLKEAFEKEKIEFAFPTRTIYLEK